jgi:phosphoserine phosphatase RsbU/P
MTAIDSSSNPHYPLDGLVTLLALSRDIGIHSDLDTLLRRVEAAALRVLDCERLSVFVNEPMSQDLRSRLATGGLEIRTPAGRGIAGAVFREGTLINLTDAQADPRFYTEIDRQTGFTTRTLLAVPLRGVDNQVIGVLELLNKRDGSFTATDEELALTLGSLTGITLQRQILFDQYREKQRLEHDLQLARNIQRSLLPVSDPQVPGYDIAGWTQAAAATGGDFYDYFDLPDGRLGLVVADVAGHGLAASLLACETRALIRAAVGSNGTVAGVVDRVNELLFRDLHNERFVVLFVGALAPGTGRLEFVGAGCAPLLYRHASREFSVMESTMAPLGIFPIVADGAVTEVTLHPGDVLMLATDGFYEWENESRDQFGLERLADVVRVNAGASAGDLIRRLYQVVSAHAESVKQADDLTALVVVRGADVPGERAHELRQ